MAIDDEHRYCRLMKSLDQRLSPNRRHVLNHKPCYEPQQQAELKGLGGGSRGKDYEHREQHQLAFVCILMHPSLGNRARW